MRLLPAEAGPGRAGRASSGSARSHPFSPSPSTNLCTPPSSAPAVDSGGRLRPPIPPFVFPEGA
eukprot:7657989-Pyramimonas_sp.AAC.1